MLIKELLDSPGSGGGNIPTVKEIYMTFMKVNKDIADDPDSDEPIIDMRDEETNAHQIHAWFEDRGVTETIAARLAKELVAYVTDNDLPSMPPGHN